MRHKTLVAIILLVLLLAGLSYLLNTTRPTVIRSIAGKVDHVQRDELEARLGPARPMPSPEAQAADIASYMLQIGIREGCNDADAGWLVAVASIHPERDVRLAVLSRFPAIYSEGAFGDFKPSMASTHWRNQASSLLLEHLQSDPEAAACAAAAVCSGRLWKRDARLGDAVSALDSTQDPVLRSIVAPCSPEIR